MQLLLYKYFSTNRTLHFSIHLNNTWRLKSPWANDTSPPPTEIFIQLHSNQQPRILPRDQRDKSGTHQESISINFETREEKCIHSA